MPSLLAFGKQQGPHLAKVIGVKPLQTSNANIIPTIVAHDSSKGDIFVIEFFSDTAEVLSSDQMLKPAVQIFYLDKLTQLPNASYCQITGSIHPRFQMYDIVLFVGDSTQTPSDLVNLSRRIQYYISLSTECFIVVDSIHEIPSQIVACVNLLLTFALVLFHQPITHINIDVSQSIQSCQDLSDHLLTTIFPLSVDLLKQSSPSATFSLIAEVTLKKILHHLKVRCVVNGETTTFLIGMCLPRPHQDAINIVDSVHHRNGSDFFDVIRPQHLLKCAQQIIGCDVSVISNTHSVLLHSIIEQLSITACLHNRLLVLLQNSTLTLNAIWNNFEELFRQCPNWLIDEDQNYLHGPQLTIETISLAASLAYVSTFLSHDDQSEVSSLETIQKSKHSRKGPLKMMCARLALEVTNTSRQEFATIYVRPSACRIQFVSSSKNLQYLFKSIKKTKQFQTIIFIPINSIVMSPSNDEEDSGNPDSCVPLTQSDLKVAIQSKKTILFALVGDVLPFQQQLDSSIFSNENLVLMNVEHGSSIIEQCVQVAMVLQVKCMWSSGCSCPFRSTVSQSFSDGGSSKIGTICQRFTSLIPEEMTCLDGEIALYAVPHDFHVSETNENITVFPFRDLRPTEQICLLGLFPFQFSSDIVFKQRSRRESSTKSDESFEESFSDFLKIVTLHRRVKVDTVLPDFF